MFQVQRAVDYFLRFETDDVVVRYEDGKRMDIPRRMLGKNWPPEPKAAFLYEATRWRKNIDEVARDKKFGAAWLDFYEHELERIKCPAS